MEVSAWHGMQLPIQDAQTCPAPGLESHSFWGSSHNLNEEI